MKNRRSILRTLAVVATAGSFAALSGCAGGGGGNGGEGGGDVTLTWWHNATQDPLSGYWDDVARQFEEENPG
ncbi:MAG: sugar ABC transporter substrate-binding protein, partial [Actinomycetota bacterium]|nr:sugar ABC transporter substrate-binding protein [Actinomycetota bacterium]